MNRRALLLGAGAAFALAGAAAAYRGRRVLREVLADGCIIPPLPPGYSSTVLIEERVFRSRVLRKNVGLTILRGAPARARIEKSAVVFALPGRGATARDQVFGLHLPAYLGAAIDTFGRPLTLVAVDGGESYWHPRRGGEDRMRMLIEEVVLPMRGQYEKMAIMGWSMGAYGAILAAQLHPDLFRGVCADSVALWRSAAEQQSAVPDAFDGTADFERFNVLRNVARLSATPVRISCGTSDPFYAADRALVQAMRAEGQTPEVHFAPGCHDGAFWQRSARGDFAFLMRASLDKLGGPSIPQGDRTR